MELHDLAIAGNRRENAERTAAFILEKPKERLEELFELFKTGNKLLQQRGSYPLYIIANIKPKVFTPFHAEVLHFTKHHLHQAVERNMLVILLSQDGFKEDILGELIDFCFELLNNPSKKVASRALAAKILHKQVKHYPELIPELKQVLEFHFEESSSGLKACARNILKQL